MKSIKPPGEHNFEHITLILWFCKPNTRLYEHNPSDPTVSKQPYFINKTGEKSFRKILITVKTPFPVNTVI